MSTRGDGLVDRLSERGYVDRWGFLLFAAGGGTAILLAKLFGVSATLVAAGAAMTMVAYAVLVQFSGTGRLRADQAGDNCYYLGLIYTLVSLAYAIFLFDPAGTATTIVQGFGIALATTIMGLVLRVFFNQTRVDLVQTEDTARVELADAAGRLKAELAAMVVSMNDFGRQTRQSLEELRDGVVDALGEVQATASATVAAASAQASQAVADATTQASEAIATNTARATQALTYTSAEAAKAIAEQSSEAVARARRLAAATEKVVSGIERHAGTLGVVETATAGIAASLAALEGAAEATRGSMDALASRADDVGGAQAGVASAARELELSVGALREQIQGFDGAAGRFDELVASRIEEVRRVPDDIAARAAASIEVAVAAIRAGLESAVAAQEEARRKTAEAAAESARGADAATTAFRESLEKIVAAQDQATAAIARGAADGVAAVERHNAALEEELARARGNVAKVHSALVDMTGELASQVEARAAEARAA